MSNSLGWRKKTAIVIYALIGVYVFVRLYFGISCFFSTLYVYSLLSILLYSIAKQKKAYNLILAASTVLLMLFVSDVFLRFIIKYPITYSEANGSGYLSTPLYQKLENIIFLKVKGRKDIHTLEFDPFEVRNLADVENIDREDELCNKLGTRGPLPVKNKRVVLALGDSFTEGACVPLDSSYPMVLQNYLYSIDTNFEVLNAGVSGNDPFYDWKMLQKLQHKYNLTDVVFLINSTDLNDIVTRGGNERFVSDGSLRFPETPWWERIYAISYVFRLITHNLYKLNYSFHTIEQNYVLKNSAVKKLKHLFENEIIPYCQGKGINIVVAQHPLDHELYNDKFEYDMFSEIIKNMKGVTYVNCYEKIKAQNLKTPLYYQIDKHFCGVGYEIIAATIFKNYFEVSDRKQLTE